jgi:hypothetical protein
MMHTLNKNLISELNEQGFVLLPSAIPEDSLSTIVDCLEPIRLRSLRTAAGLRNILRDCPPIREFACGGLASEIALQVLGKGPRPVRAILFDKNPVANWYVTWHQDLSIPVKERIEVPGFGPCSQKDGVTHVQPPVSVLEEMVSLRIHIDDSTVDNGAIKFLPGSHRCGVMDGTQITEWRETRTAITCAAKRGDVIIMRPLILHSSSQSDNPSHRRVLHIEFSCSDLPEPLQWAEA